MKWEYKRVYATESYARKELCDAGEAGWELVAVVEHAERKDLHGFYLKRPQAEAAGNVPGFDQAGAIDLLRLAIEALNEDKPHAWHVANQIRWFLGRECNRAA